ncbi:hypothetical protein EC957_010045 [Mortierella hygrophila]|uniref:Uncharacterized protein n=1 Tax=Mortierella hygrophila TaxID=979708 RepID=A0A9P6K7W4_9FUNG|nr:hypothetical protein EC957_010045 [Mortierella hygrophila]
MSLLHTLSRSARPSFLPRTHFPATATGTATAAVSLGLSCLFSRHYTSAASVSEAVIRPTTSTPATETATSLYTFKDLSEQEVLFVEMRHHKVSWKEIGVYYGKSSLEAFYGYIPIATRAFKHQWRSRMTSEDVAEHLRLQGQRR